MRCPACDQPGLKHRHDRVSGRVVRSGEKYLMQCEACGQTPVATWQELRRLGDRPPLFWWIPGVTGAIVLSIDVGMTLLRWYFSGVTELSPEMVLSLVPALFIAGAAFTLALALEHLYLAVNSEALVERLQHVAGTVGAGLMTALIITMIVLLRIEIRKEAMREQVRLEASRTEQTAGAASATEPRP